jgi:twitching motility protein PilT
MDIFSLLDSAKSKNASDLLLSANNLPLIRVDSALEKLENGGPLSPGDLDEALRQLATPEEREYFHREHELDFGYSLPDGTRLRCNAAVETGATSLAIRILPTKVPTIDELELPQILKGLISLPRGLIVVSGPTGSGKTTTQAAMIQHLNTTVLAIS